MRIAYCTPRRTRSRSVGDVARDGDDWPGPLCSDLVHAAGCGGGGEATVAQVGLEVSVGFVADRVEDPGTVVPVDHDGEPALGHEAVAAEGCVAA